MLADTIPGFAQQVAEWQTFYATLVGATATLLGLLFVALALNVEMFTRGEHAHAKALARHTLRAYLNMFIVAMLFLVPRESALVLGIGLVVIGFLGELDLLHYFRAARALGIRESWLRLRLGFVSLCHGGLVIVGFRLIFDRPTSLLWLAPLVLTLLVSATRNCWHLLLEVRRPPSDR